ncbi:MAG: CHAT domain-containing protein [Saprospirales bacterium]|nr:CHAT domain-containing protein [Saprospirales bacterium]
MHTLPNDEALYTALQRYIGYFKDANASLSDPAGYFEAAHALFALLIPREAAALLDESGALLVIPDGPLGYLPFEALLTESYTGKGFGQAPYLIKKLPVQYSWSAELLWRPGPERKEGAVVQFDPQFSKGERGLVPLVQGKKETAPLAKLRRLAGSAAVLAEFQRRAPKSLLLHLSTHASARWAASQVEFFDQARGLPQLYALLLPTELVVLSACETNLGQIAAGEGVMSLARGFAYAGANSLIATQWEINESSTAQILAQFYKGLSNKQPKLEALRQAKLQYLETTPSAAQQSPYFWAGLSFVHGQEQCSNSLSFPLWGWGLPPVLPFFWGFCCFRRFR